jgi:hypothetical protein
MPRGCTPHAACGGDCFDDEDHRHNMTWARYWESLNEAGRDLEYEMMAAYSQEQSDERKRLGVET